jgi:flagellar protein FlaJ
MMEGIYRKTRWIYSTRYINWLEKNLQYSGLEIGVGKFVALSSLYSIAISLLLFSFLFLMGQSILSLLSFLLIPVLPLAFDLLIVMIGDKRCNFAESVLPDALQLMAANIRSGLTPDKALLFSAQPEFGMLEKEIKFAASKAVAGEPIEDALISLGNRIKSRIINRTFNLIVEGMKKGGEMASLLEQTSEDIRDLKLLKREIAAQVGMYAIFIFIAVGFAAPLLFAFSSYLVETMSTIGSKLNIGESSNYAVIGSIKLGVVKISPQFLINYSLLTLTIASIFGSMVIGLLQDGKEKAGIKYIPLILLLNMTIFFLARFVLSRAIGIIAP